ncbi:translation initiation factor IF-2 [Guyparkeria hydrothermalis]|uniref:translation initiation factor IF-2 n=1 Tax=Guyparkeria TaxID=2035712 RepID=UPI0010ACAB53|nr:MULTISPECIES: translation initiation factor IF-2 [Guyparkeria]MCL7751485.1 translation initiation factor IF-2 [Guyparkeria hydrothermalis]TKA88695.1 translation initiation factor IF-2 [Guyparkeria sp. SB14A]
MSEVTVKELAKVVGATPERLLEQLAEAGVSASSVDASVSDDDKMKLLAHLRKSRSSGEGEAKKPSSRITLKRRSQQEIKVGGGARGGKTVAVEYRRRKTYVPRDEVEQPEEAEQVEQPAEEVTPTAAVEEQQPAAEAAPAVEETSKAEAAEPVEADETPAEPEPVAEPAAEAEEQPAEEPVEETAAEESAPVEDAAAEAGEDKDDGKKKSRLRIVAMPEEAPGIPVSADEGKPKRGKHGGKGRHARENAREELHLGAGAGRRRKKGKKGAASKTAVATRHTFEKPTAPVVRDVNVPESISVEDLAQRMAVKGVDVVKTLFNMGVMATINQVLDQDTAILVVEEMGHKPHAESETAIEDEALKQVEQGEAKPRPPVVTVMGHVDHGKTSLLDYIRTAKVTAGEAGGITQHVGAYHVDTPRGTVTFLDTPGHEAFTAMRARGASATDVVVLVVAADDGVMPQTKEAIHHARAGNVPMVVAVNKIDKDGADPERVRAELSQEEVISEEWGGDTQFVHVSAHTGEGIDQLLEAILLQAELQELKAPVEGHAIGTVVESSLEKGRGPVATILVQSGTLKKGDTVVVGKEYGRVRALLDENGQQVKSAGPSIPVVVLGLSGTPEAGDELVVIEDERKAREIAEFREAKQRDSRLAAQQAAKLENLFEQMKEGEVESLNVLVKADVQGSAEAIRDSLQKLSTDEVKVNVLMSGVGGINESDINLASTSSAIVIGFNVRADAAARKTAGEQDVEIRYYSVIYEMLDDVKAAMSGLLGTETQEKFVGLAEVRDVFRSPKLGAIAGCMVTEGVVKRNNPIRVLRDNVVIYEGELESLRRFKDDVQEVRSGMECGIGVKNYNDVKVGDQIEVFERVEVQRTL